MLLGRLFLALLWCAPRGIDSLMGGSLHHSVSPPLPSPPSPRTSPIVCGPTVRIVSVGKSKEQWLQSAIDEYTKRLRGAQIELRCVNVKGDQQLIAEAAAAGDGLVVLDERGAQTDSDGFARILYEALERGGSRVSFVIGAAEGLPPQLKAQAKAGKHTMISLSQMTFTHQMARLFLAEQIYRATEIRKGSAYHKSEERIK
tara:strand:+ start:316 stop:918 length:603 start_codon:yes stop_codon:yes gene_type:complete